MGFVTLDDNFSNHPKVVSARTQERTAVDLYVCGLCYCRRYNTEGFIQSGAVNGLGVASPRKAVDALVSARLWDRVDGGFAIHDYASWYPTDDAQKVIRDELREKKRAAGRKGGLRSWEVRSASSTSEAEVEADSKQPASSSASTSAPAHSGEGVGIGSASVLGEGGLGGTAPPLDRWFLELCDRYPANRVTRGRLTEGFWIEQFQKDHRPPSDVWADIQDGLANQLAGHEWRVKGMVPKLEKWLRDGLWRQRHDPEPPAAERMTRSTATTFGAAAEILNAPDVPGTDRR